jgi:hypothetical protein
MKDGFTLILSRAVVSLCITAPLAAIASFCIVWGIDSQTWSGLHGVLLAAFGVVGVRSDWWFSWEWTTMAIMQCALPYVVMALALHHYRTVRSGRASLVRGWRGFVCLGFMNLLGLIGVLLLARLGSTIRVGLPREWIGDIANVGRATRIIAYVLDRMVTLGVPAATLTVTGYELYTLVRTWRRNNP